MVRVTDDISLSPEHVLLYHISDPLLGHLPILVFHGPSTTANYTLNSSRVQIHVFSPAGFRCFPRLTISPTSPYYAVVNHLPRELQGDEVYRALAFGLYKYFQELSDGVKTYLRNAYPVKGRRPGSGPMLFSEQHTADLVKEMVKSELTADVIATLREALQTQHISNVDIDFILPPGAIVPLQNADLEEVPDDEDDIMDPTLRQYGGYTPLVKLFGEPVFLPTSRLRRAPSKPTSLNRGKSFSKDQKKELRMRLGELVDTEERYVGKLYELSSIASDFRDSAKSRDPGSLSPSEEELEKLFPKSADQIQKINAVFMRELRDIMDSTEVEASYDMDTPTISFTGSKIGPNARSRDPSGALSMARLFLEWFPRFTECYQNYIKASQHFPTLLNSFLNQQSSFKQRVQSRGEQSVRSILIEPVQRLPRYSLLIDQIVASLPMTHPALQPMLKARDIITNICSMDDPLPDKPHVANRLRNMVEAWPQELEPKGRLTLACDFVEIAPPFDPDMNQSDKTGVFLLFGDCIVVLKKLGGSMNSRDLLREIDKPSAAGLLISMTNAAGGPAAYDFVFTGWHTLADVRLTHSQDGSLVWMTSTKDMRGAHGGDHKISKSATSRCFKLLDTFEGRAAKWDEDVVKARIEARFSEAERENPTWTLRSVRMPDSNLGFHAAVFQEGADQLIEGRREPAPVRVVVDYDKGTKGAPVGHYGVEIVVSVKSGDTDRLSIATAGLDGKSYQDEALVEDLLPTMSRRIIQLASSQFNVNNKLLTPAMVSYNSKILRGLRLSTRAEKTRSFLSTSPVKLLSSIWNAGSSNNNTADTPSKHQKMPSLSRNNSQTSIFSSLRGNKEKVATEETRPENPLVRLEQTFNGYMAILQARKGAVIGRAWLNRSMVDELSVNDLYNRLIESPYDLEASSELGAEVVFVAFEKFMRVAWAEQMGPVMSVQSLDTLLERANKRVPGEFADFVNYLFRDMAPQNRRAFTAIIRLLADLLDGCGNDSDRGALTLAFAELLVDDGSAQNYINLLDRLVEDCDRIFDEPGLNHSFNLGNAAYESINSALRGDKAYTASITSNTSSLRRKFGLEGLLRQNSKDERSSVWRTFSKHRNPATGEANSLSRVNLGRTRSIDDNSLPKHGRRRPESRDRPPIAGTFDDFSRPTSSHRVDQGLETIGEPAHEIAKPMPRRKRRSSLSDLKSLMAAVSLGDGLDLDPERETKPVRPLQITKQNSEKINSAPRAASPSKIPVSPNAAQVLKAARMKENDPFVEDHETIARSKEDLSPVKQTSSTRPSPNKTLSQSGIPTLKPAKPGISDAESPIRPSTNPTRTHKLRLQSPQKLRERLQTEKKAVDEVDASLQTELSKIGEEMARVNAAGLSDTSPYTSLQTLAASVQGLEERLPASIRDLAGKQAALEHEMETTLKATETKLKAIDQLHKETTAENELLYERFNGELAKIVKALKGKGREDKEELLTKLKEQGEEVARMKKENSRLKREMVSLRAALRSTE